MDIAVSILMLIFSHYNSRKGEISPIINARHIGRPGHFSRPCLAQSMTACSLWIHTLFCYLLLITNATLILLFCTSQPNITRLVGNNNHSGSAQAVSFQRMWHPLAAGHQSVDLLYVALSNCWGWAKSSDPVRGNCQPGAAQANYKAYPV